MSDGLRSASTNARHLGGRHASGPSRVVVRAETRVYGASRFRGGAGGGALVLVVQEGEGEGLPPLVVQGYFSRTKRVSSSRDTRRVGGGRASLREERGESASAPRAAVATHHVRPDAASHHGMSVTSHSRPSYVCMKTLKVEWTYGITVARETSSRTMPENQLRSWPLRKASVSNACGRDKGGTRQQGESGERGERESGLVGRLPFFANVESTTTRHDATRLAAACRGRGDDESKQHSAVGALCHAQAHDTTQQHNRRLPANRPATS